jgi:hypothetical protein
VSSSKSNYAGTDVTNIESTLTAGGTAAITTPGALVIDGSTVSGGKVVIDAGSLDILSRQDTSTYGASSHSASVGASVSFSGQVSVNGNLSNGKQNGTFASVAEQAGISAGSGGFDITVHRNTNLVGAVIASSAEAAKNTLVTGTLTASDIQNHEKWSASQTSLGGGIGNIGANRDGEASQTGASPLPGVNVAGLGTVTATPPIAMSASGGQSGVTGSAIAPGIITIASGDAASQQIAASIGRETSSANSGAIGQEFTDTKRNEIGEGFQAAQILVTETAAFLSEQGKKADDWDKANPEAKKNGETNPYAIWGAGGAGQLVLTALSGAAGGNVTGGLGSLVQNAAVNVLQGLTVTKVKEIADSFSTEVDDNGHPVPNDASETVRTALQALTACAGSAVGGSGDCASGAMGAAASVVLNNLLSSGTTTGTDEKGRPLTVEAQQARENIVATIVGGIAAASGLNVTAAVTAAQVETENNAIVPTTGPTYDVRNVCTANEPICLNALPFDKWALAEEGSTERKEYEEIRRVLGTEHDVDDTINVLEAIYWGQVPVGDAVEYIKRGYSWSEAGQLWEANKALGANGVFSALNTDNWQAYSVAPGETLSSLLEAVPGMRMADLLAANPAIDPNAIQAGQVIHLPTQAFIDSGIKAKLTFVRLEHYLEQTGGVIDRDVDLRHLPAFAGEEEAVAEINALPDKVAAAWIAINAPGATTEQITSAVTVLQSEAVPKPLPPQVGNETEILEDVKEGTPAWLERVRLGVEFNKEEGKKFTYNEIPVLKADGSCCYFVDSYDPINEEIVSRKYTQLSAVKEATAIGYINELPKKYAAGTTIPDVPSARNLAGTELTGDMYLDVPVQTHPIPQAVLDAAKAADVQIRDTNGKVYN